MASLSLAEISRRRPVSVRFFRDSAAKPKLR
jgi:hypothetical protein